MMRGGNREMRRMLDKMGLEMKGKDSTIFQVVASDIEERKKEIPSFKEEDVILVMQQANVTKEKAIQSLIDSKGDIAQAILGLTS